MTDWSLSTRSRAIRKSPSSCLWLLDTISGSFTYRGLGLGAVTATLIAAVIIGQLGITVTELLKPFFFLMFLFAIGYGVGPRFVRGIAQGRSRQASVRRGGLPCLPCPGAPPRSPPEGGRVRRSVPPAGLDAGSTTISASMGPATDAVITVIARRPDETEEASRCDAGRCYAVTDILGTMGIEHASWHRPGPALLGIDLEPRAQLRGEARGKKESGWSWHGLEPVLGTLRAVPRSRGGTGRRQDGARSRDAGWWGTGIHRAYPARAVRSSRRPAIAFFRRVTSWRWRPRRE